MCLHLHQILRTFNYFSDFTNDPIHSNVYCLVSRSFYSFFCVCVGGGIFCYFFLLGSCLCHLIHDTINDFHSFIFVNIFFMVQYAASEKALCVAEKNVYSVSSGWSILQISVKSLMYLNSEVYFCLFLISKICEKMKVGY